MRGGSRRHPDVRCQLCCRAWTGIGTRPHCRPQMDTPPAKWMGWNPESTSPELRATEERGGAGPSHESWRGARPGHESCRGARPDALPGSEARPRVPLGRRPPRGPPASALALSSSLWALVSVVSWARAGWHQGTAHTTELLEQHGIPSGRARGGCPAASALAFEVRVTYH